ncbi:putative FAD dependent oxidoreductase [Naematelia encephala]|uniref:Putative FAD dependent oxidoreductase n=1 Tax=Naematelia encephala TaxID=71784 RepID=A0A1Y2BKM3_9TREE|nr:putative FAD dependent oxidoreductase [Naematelia encephala]
MRLEDTGVIGGAEGPRLPGEAQVNPTDTGLPLAEGMSLSYWLQGVRNRPLLNARTTEELPKEADVVVIGSGITGSLAALKLLESENPPKSVVVLEAREFCSGATGRNAGHCRPDQYRGFAKYSILHGPEQALKIMDNERETWEKVVQYVKDENVDCDLWVGKSYEVSMTPDVAEQATKIYADVVAAGGKTDNITVVTDPAEAEKISRLKGAQAVYYWDASTLYPWKLAAHVAGKALDLGLNIQTWTPVTAVTEAPSSPGQWNVETARGIITTPTVLYATNAYTGALLPETRGAIRPVPHMCNKVVPPTSFSGSKALQNSYGVIYPNGFFSVNPRPTSDGIVLVGGWNYNYPALVEHVAQDSSRRYNDGLTNFEPVTDAVKELTQDKFGWADQTGPGTKANYDYAWSGIIGRSSDEVPFIGAVPGKEGQWICAGHNGHGMARIFTAAPGIVKLMQGATWAETGLPECFEVSEERLARLAKADIKIDIVQ